MDKSEKGKYFCLNKSSLSKAMVDKLRLQVLDRAWSKCEQVTLPITVKMYQSIHKLGWTAFPLRCHSHCYYIRNE